MLASFDPVYERRSVITTLCQLADARGSDDAVVAGRRLVFVAVLLGFVAVVPDLKASCGDYVTIGGDHASAMNGHVRSPVGAESALPPAARCQGPNCHRQAPAPTSPSREPPTLRSTDWACWLPVADRSSLTAASLAIGESPQTLDGYPFAIKHPPRLDG